MNSRLKPTFVFLFLPYLTAELFSTDPELSYYIAWAGSFLIFYLSIGGKVRALPQDLSLGQQVMRPFILSHLIFAGYMAVTSIFYFQSLLEQLPTPLNLKAIELAAQCQRYYVLMHAAYATGLLLGMNYPQRSPWKVALRKGSSFSSFMLQITIGASIAGILLRVVPGLAQVQVMMGRMGLVASVLALSMALPERKTGPLLISLGLFGLNFLAALLSGWKEQVAVMMILLAFLVYPYYKKSVIIGLPLAAFVWVTFIPTFNVIFRQQSWKEGVDSQTAAANAFEALQEMDEEDIEANNESFLNNRISEIGMFSKYISGMEKRGEYYGWQIAQQSLESLIPRVFWPTKPVTERLVMKRPIELGVIHELAKVSAKPPYVVDAYLSGGVWGVIIGGLVLGWFTSFASVKAEEWFGGYLFGTALMFNSFFQSLWRTNCFEFLFNNMFWCFIVMYVIFRLGRSTGLIIPNRLQWVYAPPAFARS